MASAMAESTLTQRVSNAFGLGGTTNAASSSRRSGWTSKPNGTSSVVSSPSRIARKLLVAG